MTGNEEHRAALGNDMYWHVKSASLRSPEFSRQVDDFRDRQRVIFQVDFRNSQKEGDSAIGIVISSDFDPRRFRRWRVVSFQAKVADSDRNGIGSNARESERREQEQEK